MGNPRGVRALEWPIMHISGGVAITDTLPLSAALGDYIPYEKVPLGRFSSFHPSSTGDFVKRNAIDRLSGFTYDSSPVAVAVRSLQIIMEIGWVLCNKCNRRPGDVPGILTWPSPWPEHNACKN